MDFLNDIVLEEENQNIVQSNMDIKQAFICSYHHHNLFDLEEIMSLANASKEDVIQELKPVLIKDPYNQEYTFIFDYLKNNKFDLYKELKEENQIDDANLILSLLQQNTTFTDYDRELLPISIKKGSKEELRKVIGYLPVKHTIHDFFDVENKEYETDYLHMLLNRSTIEVCDNINVFYEWITLYHHYFPENNIYIVAPKEDYNMLKKYYKNDGYIECMNESQWIKKASNGVDGLFLAYHFDRLSKSQALINASSHIKHSVLFMNYLNLFEVDFIRYITHMRRKFHFDLDLLLLMNDHIFDHTKLNDVHYSIKEYDFGNMNIKFRSLQQTTKYMGMNKGKGSELQYHLALSNEPFSRDSKLYNACMDMMETYYDDQNSKQLIYLDTFENSFGTHYIDLMKKILLIDENDIQVITNPKFEQNKRIYISKTKDVDIDSIHGLTHVISLDVPERLEELMKRGSFESTTLYVTLNSVDQTSINNLKDMLHSYYLITRNIMYLMLARFDTLQKVINVSKINIMKLLEEEK